VCWSLLPCCGLLRATCSLLSAVMEQREIKKEVSLVWPASKSSVI
jgi:hypothetical protein